MSPVAENLTGWKAEEGEGKSLTDVFRIVNEQSRAPVENPDDKVRRLNGVVGLAKHTVLIAKGGEEYLIDECLVCTANRGSREQLTFPNSLIASRN